MLPGVALESAILFATVKKNRRQGCEAPGADASYTEWLSKVRHRFAGKPTVGCYDNQGGMANIPQRHVERDIRHSILREHDIIEGFQP